MSDLYDPRFIRPKIGNYNKNKNFTAVVAGTDSYFLEDECNEMQQMQNDARIEMLRMQYYSGILKKNDTPKNILYSDKTIRENFMAINHMTALVNGHMVNVAGSNGLLDNTIKKHDINNIILPPSPDIGTRLDLIYLEVWFSEIKYDSDIWYSGNKNNYHGLITNDIFDHRINGETCRRIQMQWAIRVASGVDKNTIGFDESLNATIVPARGAYDTISDYGFWRSDKRLDTQLELDDVGLWVAGRGISGEMNTVDGYSYAIPLFKVHRRNTGPYSEYNRNGGAIYNVNTISDRPDGKFSNIIYEDDIIDLRNMINYKSDDLKKALESSFIDLMTGNLNSIDQRKTLIGYFGIDTITPSTNTALYLNFNKKTNYNGIIAAESLTYNYVIGVEQEAIKIMSHGHLSYDINFELDNATIHMFCKFDSLDNKDIWSLFADSNEILYCYVNNYKLTVGCKSDDQLITVDLNNSDAINTLEFFHLAISWSKSKQKLYLLLNGKIVSAVDLPEMLDTTLLKQFNIGSTSKNLGSVGTIFDEIEILKNFTIAFSSLPADFMEGNAKIFVDTQLGRKNYSLTPATVLMTKHISANTDSSGIAKFSILAPTGTVFNDTTPRLYYDNEAVIVNSVIWDKTNPEMLTAEISGLGAWLTYNFVMMYELDCDANQGLTDLPQKMYGIFCEESTGMFIPVRADKLFEEHLLNSRGTNLLDINLLDKLVAYNPITFNNGFGAAVKYHIRGNNTNIIAIPKNLYGKDIISVYSVNIKDDIYNKSLLADIDMSFPDTIIMTMVNAVSSNDVIEIIACVKDPIGVYSGAAGGINNLFTVQKVLLNGDGINKSFSYRSESRIVGSQSSIINNNVQYIAFVDNKSTIIDVNIIDTFAVFNFDNPPINKSNIAIYILSEYNTLRSERIKVSYDIFKYQGSNNVNYIASFNDKDIIYHLNSIFVTTDGLNNLLETRYNKNLVNTIWLPTVGLIDNKLVPTKIFGNASSGMARIDYAEMNDLPFNNPMPLLNKLKLDVHKQIIGRGFSGYVSVDNKSLYSCQTLNTNMPHLCVLPLIVVDGDNRLKMAVITTYLDDDRIGISGEPGKSAIDIFPLSDNILYKK